MTRASERGAKGGATPRREGEEGKLKVDQEDTGFLGVGCRRRGRPYHAATHCRAPPFASGACCTAGKGGAYVSQGFGEGDDGPRKTDPRNQEGKRRTTEKEQGQKGRREGEAINNSSRTAEQQGGGRFSLTDDGDAMVQVAVIKGTVA